MVAPHGGIGDARRTERLRQELDEECGLLLDEVQLAEVGYCRFVAAHEGIRPSYGAVVLPASHDGDGDFPSPQTFVDIGADLDAMRLFANGETSFVVRRPNAAPAIAVDPSWGGDEQSLSEYVQRTSGMVVRRLASGRISIFEPSRVLSYEDGLWHVRPTTTFYATYLLDLLHDEQHDAARALLDLCTGVLSPKGVGATIVWFPLTTDPSYEGLDYSQAIRPPALVATDGTHADGIANALAQLDRAAIVDADGRLRNLNITLEYGSDQEGLVFEGGTRHNSAGRFSAMRSDAIVFVVSADGPITVFRDGAVVASVDLA